MTKRAAKRQAAAVASGDLTPKQRRFVNEYLIDLNGKQAAIRAGYAPKSAEVTASHLLSVAKVAEEIRRGAAKREQRTQITADTVLSEFLRIARVDIAEAFDEDGSLKPVHEIPEDIRRAIAGLEVEELFEGRGESRESVGRLRKVKFWDKNRALESLAKHLGLLVDRVHHDGKLELDVQVTLAES